MANEKNLVKWPKGTSGNPAGRPRKSFAKINDALKKKGYEPLKRAELIEMYTLLFNLDEEAIKELAATKDNPLAIRLAIQELTDPQTRSKALQDFRNYAFGQAQQNVDIKSGGESLKEIFIGLDISSDA